MGLPHCAKTYPPEFPNKHAASRGPENGDAHQLFVDGKPYLMLAGELQNSSFSSPTYMESVWAKLTAQNLNTVLASVSWEQIEPQEGVFNFGTLDRNIQEAREHGLRLVLLWFGSFKNGMEPCDWRMKTPSLTIPGLSTYAPPWVKLDDARFPRVQARKNGALKTMEILSLFGSELAESDCRAFHKLMSHLREVDSEHATVIMVQVENEMGMMGDARDRSVEAEACWDDVLPSPLLDLICGEAWSQLNTKMQRNFQGLHESQSPHSMTWQVLSETHPLCAEELFMAYYFALFAEKVASTGKSAYPLPLYANVWQNYGDEDRDINAPLVAAGGSQPGDYPSGEAVDNVLDVWQKLAPSLDFIAPDVYLNDYGSSCAKYQHGDQAFMIPEQRRDEYGARRVWQAYGSYKCIGAAPFGIDTVDPIQSPLRQHYKLLGKVSAHILAAQAHAGSSIGFFFDGIDANGSDPSPQVHSAFGDWELTIQRSFVFGVPSAGSGMVIHKGGDLFLLIGWGFQVVFKSRHPDAHFTGVLMFEEQEIVDSSTGEMKTLRIHGGDETRSGQCAIMPSDDPDYGGFPISITVPAGSGIALCSPYALRK